MSQADPITRRALLRRFSLALPAAGATVAALSACSGGTSGAAAAKSCVHPDELSASDASLRKANAYVEAAPDPTKTCAGCAFFTADAAGGACGTCQIFVGGPANAGGHCSSWAAKPTAS
jgi:hypothetical protein